MGSAWRWPRVRVASPDVVALLQRIREAAAPSAGHSLDQRELHRLVIAIEFVARLRLQHPSEICAACRRGNQRSGRIEHGDSRTDAVDRLVDINHAELIAR